MSLCKYKDILGIPGKGVHSYRIFNVAIVDVIMTIIAGAIIGLILKINILIPIIILFILGIILHKLFCVKTTLNNFIFGDK